MCILGRERLEQELDLLEANLPYNCEHVVPQSWFQKKEPMRGDHPEWANKIDFAQGMG